MNTSNFMDTYNVYNCSETDSIRENISYGLNIILLLITAYSEMSGACSSCNHNGIVDGLIKACGCREKKKKKRSGFRT